MKRQHEAWGGEVRLPGWIRRVLGRAAPTDTPEARSEAHRPDPSDATRFERMQAAGTVAPHHSELPRPDPRRPRSR